MDDDAMLDASASLEADVVAALRRITRAIDVHSRTLLQTHGLTAPQLAVLHAIRLLAPATAGSIARHVHLAQPTVTGILDRLVRDGLIQRARDQQDRRSVKLSLTQRGNRVLHESPSLLQDHFRNELNALQQWERTQILATLQWVADAMNTPVEGDVSVGLGAPRSLDEQPRSPPRAR